LKVDLKINHKKSVDAAVYFVAEGVEAHISKVKSNVHALGMDVGFNFPANLVFDFSATGLL
jgi:hypothetical protein